MMWEEIADFTQLVAPYAGAWIEMPKTQSASRAWSVAPYAGAWIEITAAGTAHRSCLVAPYAGAWIEINLG